VNFAKLSRKKGLKTGNFDILSSESLFETNSQLEISHKSIYDNDLK